jgi:small subunit ribosomal protein S27Ae
LNNNLCEYRLVCQGSILTEDNLSATLFENANVYLTSDLEGGKKKKKKKVYTTKKKNKHIHKKLPGLTLSLYTVDGNIFILFRKGKCHPKQKNLSIMWSRNLHGSTLGQILLWIMSHYY